MVVIAAMVPAEARVVGAMYCQRMDVGIICVSQMKLLEVMEPVLQANTKLANGSNVAPLCREKGVNGAKLLWSPLSSIVSKGELIIPDKGDMQLSCLNIDGILNQLNHQRL